MAVEVGVTTKLIPYAGAPKKYSRDPRIPTEAQIQCAIVTLLNKAAHRSLIWFHVPNEGQRSEIAKFVQKRMGFVSGAPDLAFVLPDKRAAFIEVKRPRRGVMSDNQTAFADRCEALGVPYAVARSVTEAEQILSAWGALRGSANKSGGNE